MARQTHRLAQYEQVCALREQDYTTTEITERLGMSTRTICRWLQHFRQDTHRRKRPSEFDRYAPTSGRNGRRAVATDYDCGRTCRPKAIRAPRGVRIGSCGPLRHGFVPSFAEQPLPANVVTEPEPEEAAEALLPDAVSEETPQGLPTCTHWDAFTPTQAKWCLVCDQESLIEEEQAYQTWLCQAHPTLATLYALVQAFRALLRERRVEALDAWIEACQTSGIPELRQCAKGLRPDQVGLGLPASPQAAGKGYVAPAVVNAALDCLATGTNCGTFIPPTTYPTIRGVMDWSINWDASTSYTFADTVGPHLSTLP